MFNPSRLRLARHRLGWTLTRLAEESGVSVRSISSLENGPDADPLAETVMKLAVALRVPVGFFERGSVDPVLYRAASFRKFSRTSATMRDAALAAATIALEFFALIDQRFHLPEPHLPTLDKLDPEQAAELTRRQWELGDRPIPNLVHLLESKGVRVVALAEPLREIDAFCMTRDGVPYVFLNTTKSGERRRFDAAHELGHLVLHADRDEHDGDPRARESEANRFAAAFLMPRSGVLAQSMRAASPTRIVAARSYWAVSAMAMTHRLHELGLLTDWQYRSTCVTLSDQGYRSTEPGGIVPETSALLRKVLFGPNKVNLADAASTLQIPHYELIAAVSGLVPTAA